MKVAIKRFDKSLPLPEYKTKGAAAIDLYARKDMEVEPQSIAYIPLNVALALPEDCWTLIAARSSLHKRGLMLANGIGVGDYDYRGDDDEYHAAVFNFTQKPVQVKKGERLVQIIIFKRERIEFEEQASLASKNRGGFGTTGR